MFGFLLVLSLFMTVGYAFTAVVLLALFGIFRKNPHVPGLASRANGALAFYILCNLLLLLVALVRSRAQDVPSQLVPGVLLLALALIPYLQKRPLLLLVPLALLANWNNFVHANDSSTYLAAILDQEPYVLVLFGIGYCLLTLVLYLISRWMHRFVFGTGSRGTKDN